MKYPKSITKILENKYVFYIILFLAVTNIIGYAILGNFSAIIIFIAFAYLTSLFNKNKMIILGIPLILTSLLMLGKRMKEGLENNDATNDTEIDSSADKANSKKTIPSAGSNSNIVITGPEQDASNATNPDINSDINPEVEGETPPADGMQNNKKPRIDYASTIEEAYGNLSNILGSDGIKGLTNDTQNLMKQQMQLAEAMKSMTPIVEQAQNMMKGFDFKSLGGLADMAKQFTGAGGKTSNALIQQV